MKDEFDIIRARVGLDVAVGPEDTVLYMGIGSA